MEAGHISARFYPLGMVLDEYNILVDRQNTAMADNAQLLHSAMSGAMNGKKAYEHFKSMIKTLTGKKD